eukprot:3935916-Rhodomonas_salina.1
MAHSSDCNDGHSTPSVRPAVAASWLRCGSLPSSRAVDAARMADIQFKRKGSLALVHKPSAWPGVDDATMKRAKESLSSMSFSTLSFSADSLLHIALELFTEMGVLEDLKISEQSVMLMLIKIRASMPNNMYHNWWHVVDVAQATYCMGLQTRLFDSLSSLDKFALMISALCHDMGHPGVNGAAFSNRHQAVAAIHGSFSILERRHSLLAAQLLADCELGLYQQLGAKNYFHLLETVSTAILATDMAKHSAFVETMRSNAHGQVFERLSTLDRNDADPNLPENGL